MRDSLKQSGWVKWIIIAACLVVVAIVAVPAIMNAQAQEQSASEVEDATNPEATPSYTDDDFALPAEPTLTDEAKSAIAKGLTSTSIFVPEARMSEDDLDSVTLGLPIAYYFYECGDSGTCAFNSDECYQLYPVYIDGKFDCLADYSKVFGFNGVYDYDNEEVGNDHFLVLYDRLKAGTAGSVAVILAKDGAYIYDGSSFELVSEQGEVDLGGSLDPEDDSGSSWHPASLSEADLSDELIAEIRLTDTSLTEPIL